MEKKIVLAYSGGLDTSVILKWLQLKFNCPIVTFTADIGQGEELDPVKKKAESLGVKEIFIENLQEEFVKNYVFPMQKDRLKLQNLSEQIVLPMGPRGKVTIKYVLNYLTMQIIKI